MIFRVVCHMQVINYTEVKGHRQHRLKLAPSKKESSILIIFCHNFSEANSFTVYELGFGTRMGLGDTRNNHSFYGIFFTLTFSTAITLITFTFRA